MFAKLATIILVIGMTACGLLAMRQARLQTAHELAQAQLRIARVDERLLTLHARIAERITPARVRTMNQPSGLATLGERTNETDVPTPSASRTLAVTTHDKRGDR